MSLPKQQGDDNFYGPGCGLSNIPKGIPGNSTKVVKEMMATNPVAMNQGMTLVIQSAPKGVNNAVKLSANGDVMTIYTSLSMPEVIDVLSFLPAGWSFDTALVLSGLSMRAKRMEAAKNAQDSAQEIP